jgi:hypothetical protein
MRVLREAGPGDVSSSQTVMSLPGPKPMLAPGGALFLLGSLWGSDGESEAVRSQSRSPKSLQTS